MGNISLFVKLLNSFHLITLTSNSVISRKFQKYLSLQVGSFNYDNSKMVFVDEFIADHTQIRSVLDYSIEIHSLPQHQKNYVALTGNYSVAGFEMRLRRKVSHYIITCYLPSGMFVMVSWISFLIPPDVVPGRMTLLITIFLVLVNIFNTITTNIPKAEGWKH